MQIPYGIQAYRRLDLPQVVLRNLYVEKAESVPGQVILAPRPSLANYQTVGAGPINGLYYQGGVFDSTLFTVSGTNLYAGAVNLGSVGAFGRVKMAIADTLLTVATGDAIYTYDGTLLAKASFPDDAGATDILYLAAYAVAVRKDTRRIYFTLDPTTWDGLDYVSAQQSTANIVGIAVVVDQIWLFCQDHTEIFYATGDSTAPFQRVQGRVFDKGCKSRDSIVRMDNTVIWVGNDGIVYRGEGTPVRISDHGIEERITASSSDDLVAWSYAWNGHLFYVLRTAEGSFAYDAATKQWHEVSTYGAAAWEAIVGFNYNGVIVCGGSTGQLWQLSDVPHTDTSGPVSREFTVLIDENVILDTLALDSTVGRTASAAASAGTIELRTSRDNGDNWTVWRPASLGKLGRSRTYAQWRRLGFVDETGMIIQIRVTDPVLSRISFVRINESAAGRSR